MIRKSLEAIETKAIDAERGLYSCIFSATKNQDRQDDVIDPGAFSKALTKSSVPVVYAHVWNDINQVLGRTTGWKELLPGSAELPEKLLANGLGGVKAVIQYEMGVPAGRVAATHTKNGNITDWSFAFDIDDGGEKYEDGVRHIKSIREIYEVTLALIGANPATTTMAFKAMVEAEAERWTRTRQYIADQVARGQARPKAIAANRTHVEKWIEDHAMDRTNLPMTIGDFKDVMACLEQDNAHSADHVRRVLLPSQPITPYDFKRLVDSLAEA